MRRRATSASMIESLEPRRLLSSRNDALPDLPREVTQMGRFLYMAVENGADQVFSYMDLVRYDPRTGKQVSVRGSDGTRFGAHQFELRGMPNGVLVSIVEAPASTTGLWVIEPGSTTAKPLPHANRYSDSYTTARLGNLWFYLGRENEAYVSDGTPQGTRRLSGLPSGPGTDGPRYLMNVGSHVAFVVDEAKGALRRDDVWMSDGTQTGTQWVATPPMSARQAPSNRSIIPRAMLGSELVVDVAFTKRGTKGVNFKTVMLLNPATGVWRPLPGVSGETAFVASARDQTALVARGTEVFAYVNSPDRPQLVRGLPANVFRAEYIGDRVYLSHGQFPTPNDPETDLRRYFPPGVEATNNSTTQILGSTRIDLLQPHGSIHVLDLNTFQLLPIFRSARTTGESFVQTDQGVFFRGIAGDGKSTALWHIDADNRPILQQTQNLIAGPWSVGGRAFALVGSTSSAFTDLQVTHRSVIVQWFDDINRDGVQQTDEPTVGVGGGLEDWELNTEFLDLGMGFNFADSTGRLLDMPIGEPLRWLGQPPGLDLTTPEASRVVPPMSQQAPVIRLGLADRFGLVVAVSAGGGYRFNPTDRLVAWMDSDLDGLPGLYEPSTTADEYGYFELDVARRGLHPVRVLDPTRTGEPALSIAAPTTFRRSQAGAAHDRSYVGFPPETYTSSVSLTVNAVGGAQSVRAWLDLNRNNKRDPGEPQIASLDADNNAVFSGLEGGWYRVAVRAYDGLGNFQRASRELHVNRSGSSSSSVTLRMPSASFSGRIIDDANRNGRYDKTRDRTLNVGAARVWLDLDRNGIRDDNEPLQEVFGSSFTFSNLPEGNYRVVIEPYRKWRSTSSSTLDVSAAVGTPVVSATFLVTRR